MDDYGKALTNASMLLIFTYAPAGFGHLRVTDALYHGLPTGANPVLLGAQDYSINYIHRIASNYRITRAIYEWIGKGMGENITTFLYGAFLRSRTKLLYEQLTTLIDERLKTPATVLVIATHFGLAHQIAAIKDKLAEDKKLKIILVVQVTDDSPQKMWYVPGADLTCVPSEKTKRVLEAYGRKAKLKHTDFAVNPYPISPVLAQSLTKNQYLSKQNQLDPTSTEATNLVIPISGAAVGTQYFTSLIDELYRLTHRFSLHILAKTAPFTKNFIYEMNERSFVKLTTSAVDREIIDSYENIYTHNVIALEITKPSEQAFKALISPDKKGGSILLFSEPVGRQEFDNLDFLRRHYLIPLVSEQRTLWHYAEKNIDITSDKQLHKEVHQWRGIFLPSDPVAAARFIKWAFDQKIFYEMLSSDLVKRKDDLNTYELSPRGVEEFWRKVATVL